MNKEKEDNKTNPQVNCIKRVAMNNEGAKNRGQDKTHLILYVSLLLLLLCNHDLFNKNLHEIGFTLNTDILSKSCS